MRDAAKPAADLTPRQRELLELLLKEKRARRDAPDAGTPPTLERIPRRAQSGPAPASFAQQRLWFIDQLDPGTPAFNIPAVVRIRGALDVALLQRGLDEVVRRHETLRTRFEERDGQPLQVIDPEARLELPLLSLEHLPEPERLPDVQRRVTAECQRSFDLKRCPLLRVQLLRLGADDHVLVMMMHHIIGDVWSVRVVMKELAALCEAFAAGRPSPLPELPVQYADYAAWQRDWMRGENLERQLSYWKRQLEGLPDELELTTDFPRPAYQSIWGAKHFLRFDKRLADALRALGQEERASLFMVLLGAWKALLHVYTGQDDIAVGAPVANRSRTEVEPMVGFFVNSLVLRTRLDGDPTLREIVRREREVTLGAFAHVELPFERLVEVLRPARNLSRNPLFQTDFILQNSPRSAYHVSGLSFEPLPVENGTAQLDMTLDIWEEADGLGGWLEYDTDLFRPETIARVVRHYGRVLELLVERPEMRLSELVLLEDDERRRVLVEWNASARGYDLERTFQQRFMEQVERVPDAPAARCGDETLSYRALHRRAAALSLELRARGVGRDSVVPLLGRRGLDLLTWMVAVMESGAAYLPLDPQHPAPRLRQVLEQSGARVLLASREFQGVLHEALSDLPQAPEALWGEDRAGREAEAAPVPGGGGDLAYVIFTSGSTGLPKGVMIEQRGLVNHILANVDVLEMGERDVLAQTASQCFDISVWQFLGPLMLGARVEILPDEVTLDPVRLLREVDRRGVTVFESVPSLLHVGLSEVRRDEGEKPLFRNLRYVLPTGEALPPELCRDWFRDYGHIPLVNAYGPSECSDDVTLHVLREAPGPEVHRIPIGRPVSNMKVYVLDRNGRPVPPGVRGELCIGGVGVGRGYLNDAARSAQVFGHDPFSDEPGARLYRSGDLGRHLADGTLEFLGRRDDQVKVRGFRIELGEIEAALAAHASVREAVVLARGVGEERRLVAWVAAHAGATLEPGALREHLKRQLPEYMVPSSYVMLERLPLTPNGKVDKRALPDPEVTDEARAYVAPRTPTEEALAGMWGEVLGRERVGGEDNLFDLGAHSLLLTQVVSRVRRVFRVEPPLRAFFDDPSVAGLARVIDELLTRQAAQAEAPPLVRVPRDGELPLSFTQERMWFLDQLEPGLTAYNVPGAVHMEGTLRLEALQAAFTEIVRRHEIFRTTYGSAEGRPRQFIHAPAPFDLPFFDLQHLDPAERETEALRQVKADAAAPFDLGRGPVLRARLLRLAPERHLLGVTTHHIAYDMWAREIFLHELGVLYEAFAAGRPSPLPEPEIQWADYAAWQRRYMQGELLEKQLAYWRRQLADAPRALDLPLDLPRPPVQSYRGARQYLQMPSSLARAVGALSRREGVTPFITVLAAFKVLLQRLSGEERIVVGSPIANRNRFEVERLIGFLANTLVLHTDLSGDPTFRELITRVRETALGAYAHQDLPFEFLVMDLQPARDASRAPLFQVMFNYMLNYSAPTVTLPELTLRLERLHSGAAQFELNIDMWETEVGLNGVVEYCTDLFRHETITRLVAQFRALLEGAVTQPDRRLSELPLCDDAERRQVLVEWNQSAADYPRERCVHELVLAEAPARGDAPAVTAEDGTLGYAAFAERVHRLARHLRACGVGHGTPVGVCLERRLDLAVALPAVLEAGGFYVPLDPAYPPDRLRFMLADSEAPLILTHAALEPLVDGYAGRRVCLDAAATLAVLEGADPRAPEPLAGPDDLVYLLYTSGSTGRPKGVEVSHRAVVNLLTSMARQPRFEACDVVASVSSMSFDIFEMEFYLALLVGARFVLLPQRTARDGQALLAALRAHQASVLQATPSTFRMLLGAGYAGQPKLKMITGGEALAPDLARQLLPHATWLWNQYGPTETTIYSTQHEVRHADGATIPIGRPVANTRLYVVGRDGRPLPACLPGELLIGGDGLARGYRKRPELTAERFVHDPWSGVDGARLYRTGDRARWLPDGTVEYLGRLDRQVKLRGYRIELGEIEATLAQHAAVREAVVAVRGEGDDARLVAYVVSPAGAEAGPAELRAHLKQHLPDFMVPAAYVRLDRLPVSPNGKLDRQALPDPDAEAAARAAFVEPRNADERELAQIFGELLRLPRVGAHDNFFDVGGHSLLAMQLLSRLRERLGVPLPLRAVFENASVAGLAEAVRAMRLARAFASAAPPAADPGSPMEEGTL